jgi:Calcineurin-like phosphoesterase
MASTMKTSFLILSDTHGNSFHSGGEPLQNADVAIHCGDLTDGSQLEEFRTTIQLLQAINARLKLVIAGNHDFTMDIPAFKKKVAEATPALGPELVAKAYGRPGEASQLFEEARNAGIIFLDQGSHTFKLENGVLLTVYASPYTPALGDWGFQYLPERGHDFAVGKDVDVVITHGPPRGIMDYTHGRERAGCPDLFAAVARARPKIHCFGHIHEGWGGKLVTWKGNCGEKPSHFTAIDNERSTVIEKLAWLEVSMFDTEEDVERKREKVERYEKERCVRTSHCEGDEQPLQAGMQTLFLNASVCDSGGELMQKPWLVEIELPTAR